MAISMRNPAQVDYTLPLSLLKAKETNFQTPSKTVTLFLMDGLPNGRIKCTLSGWTGVVYRIPRTELDKCKDRDDLTQSGVYFLIGVSEQADENSVYVGQAGVRKNGEGILCRLQEHKRDPKMDYWTEAVVFTTFNNSFGPTEMSYLENQFCMLTKEANRYLVKNLNDPTPGNITEESDSMPPGIRDARQKAKIDAEGLLQEDVLFRSPSYAAGFVVGGQVNGWEVWTADDGRTLADIESRE